MVIAMSKDIRVLILKLADRLHNIETIQYHNEWKQEKIANETLYVYAPLAPVSYTHLTLPTKA